MNETRELGYYWVQYKGTWVIAYYYEEKSNRFGNKGKRWWRCLTKGANYTTHLADNAFDQIIEQKIPKPEIAMTTLNVTCKRKDWDKIQSVLLICFVNRYVNVLPEENLEGGNQEEWPFNDLEWIDFGTTRWYPAGK